MRKLYFTLLSLAIAGGSAFSQSKTDLGNTAMGSKRLAPRIDNNFYEPMSSRAGGGGPIWEDDFSNPSVWTHDYDPTSCNLEWEVGVGLMAEGPAAIATIQSTTAANGFAMIDSDEYGGSTGGTCVEDSWLQTANSIDLSAYTNVVLEFETWYRRWNYEACYVVISTDGVTWPSLTPDTDISGMPNVIEVFPDVADATSLPSNPVLKRINISAAAGSQSTVWIRFHWTGTWGYAWFIDDVKVIEQPANDLVVNSSYISHTNGGEEYGRIPQSQLPSALNVGGEFYNFGFDEQTNVESTFELFDQNSTSVLLTSASFATAMVEETYNMDDSATPSAALSPGIYEGVFTVVSDEEPVGSGTFGNNTHLRNFEVTTNSYSLDGLGNHPAGYQNVGSLGTNSFTDAADGFMLFAYYEVAQQMAFMGVEILLSSTTVAGGSIIVSVHDTADVRADDVVSPFEQTDVMDITQADVDAGMITVMFAEPFVADPNGYYVGVEMFSNTNANDIRILDDLTVPQPGNATLIYIPNDAVYGNGNAAAIRLITADNVGIGTVQQLSGISIYPNPTEDMVRINISEKGNYTVEVINVLGEMVGTINTNSSLNLNLGQYGSGVYVLKVSTAEAVRTQKVIVQ